MASAPHDNHPEVLIERYKGACAEEVTAGYATEVSARLMQQQNTDVCLTASPPHRSSLAMWSATP
eukprot:2637037-Prymnesium_polylepis.3